jgi:hypothetical protein
MANMIDCPDNCGKQIHEYAKSCLCGWSMHSKKAEQPAKDVRRPVAPKLLTEEEIKKHYSLPTCLTPSCKFTGSYRYEKTGALYCSYCFLVERPLKEVRKDTLMGVGKEIIPKLSNDVGLYVKQALGALI